MYLKYAMEKKKLCFDLGFKLCENRILYAKDPKMRKLGELEKKWTHKKAKYCSPSYKPLFPVLNSTPYQLKYHL